MRSFQIVEDKIKETDFFLEKIKESSFGKEMFWGTRYYLSAFLSASRSITFSLQASMNGIVNFEQWYENHQEKLKNNDFARFFLEARNLSQKAGYYPLSGGRSFLDENDELKIEYFFDKNNFSNKIKSPIPKEDVITVCTKYFSLLLEVICDCFKHFGNVIDPISYFEFSISEGGKSLEDIEEELVFPRGWTAVAGISYKERVRMLRQQFEKDETLDYVFLKYLGAN